MLGDIFGIVLILVIFACPILILIGLAATWGRRRLTPEAIVFGVIAIVLSVIGLWIAINPIVTGGGITCIDMPVFDLHGNDTAECISESRWHTAIALALAVVPTAIWVYVTIRGARRVKEVSASHSESSGAGTSGRSES